MKKTVCFIFILFFLIPVRAQEKAFAVWQGFEHKWTYNHRLNRLGDYIAQSAFQKSPHPYTAAHTGATGLGKDTAVFRSYFATVKSKDLYYFPGIEKLKLEGLQGDFIQLTKKIFIVDPVLAKKSQLAVIFNGLDLVSENGADKLQLLKINFSDPVRRNQSDTIELLIEAALVVNCTSFECDRFNKKFRYNLNLRYLLVGADADKMHITTKDYNESATWTREKNSAETSMMTTIQGYKGFKNAVLAFKNIFIVLNQDHWILSYANAITRSDYNNLSGSMRMQHIAYIRQWVTGMKQVSSQSTFSEKRPGWGMLQGTLQLLQFNSGNVSYYERHGYIDWDGNNEDPDNEQSVNRENLVIK